MGYLEVQPVFAEVRDMVCAKPGTGIGIKQRGKEEKILTFTKTGNLFAAF